MAAITNSNRGLYGLLLLLLIATSLLIWRTTTLEAKLAEESSRRELLYKQRTQQFAQLQDHLSARSGVVQVQPPTAFDKLFNTERNKLYKDLLAQIPLVIREEIKNMPKSTQISEIHKSQILLTGDSVKFYNKDGFVTKVAKVIPLPGDSSLFVLVPQTLEITGVRVEDNKDGKINYFLNARNLTTGKTLQVTHSEVYAIATKKKLSLKVRPEIALSYRTDYGSTLTGGIRTIHYESNKVSAEILTLKGAVSERKPFAEVEVLRLSLK